MNAPHQPSRSPRRGLVITAVAAAALLGGGALAAADPSGDVGADVGSSSAPTSSAPNSTGDLGGPGAAISGGSAKAVHVPHLDGDVTAVDEGRILISDHDGFTRTILVADTTTYAEGLSLPIEIGEHIRAEGAVADDGTSLDATVISTAPRPPVPGLAGPAGGPADGGPPPRAADGSAPTTVAPTG